MTALGENIDKFGLLTEDRHSQIRSEDARTQLERAKDELRRAIDSLRDLQKTMSPTDRVGAEIRSSIKSCFATEVVLNNSIHWVESIVHRIRKMESNPVAATQGESVEAGARILMEEEMEVKIEHGGKKLVALFDVEGTLAKDGGGGAEWVKQPKVHLLGVTLEDDPNEEVPGNQFDAKTIEKLEDEAIEKYASWFSDTVLYGEKSHD